MSAAAVILVNWNGWRDTLECLASLQGLRTRPRVIVIVDNASTDGSVAHIEAWCSGQESACPQRRAAELPPWRAEAPEGLTWITLDERDVTPDSLAGIVLLRSSKNRGFAGGNNLGIRLALAAGVDYLWLLNTDTVVDPSALDALIDRADEVPRAGMVGSTLLYYWRPNEVQALGGARFDARTGAASHIGSGASISQVPSDASAVEAQTDYVVGASMLVTRAMLESVGEMCEDYFLYFEEVDWALRARGRFTIAYAPQSRVFHKVGGSSRRTASRTSLRYLYRNRLHFVSKFYPEVLPSARRHMLLQVLQHLRRGHWGDVIEIASALVQRKHA